MGADKDHVRAQITYLDKHITQESVADPGLIVKAMKERRPHVAAEVATSVKSLMRFLASDKSDWIAQADRDAITAKVSAHSSKLKVLCSCAQNTLKSPAS